LEEDVKAKYKIKAIDTISKSILFGIDFGLLFYVVPKLISAKDDIQVLCGLGIVAINVILGAIWLRIEISKRRK
jgi:hypothetical protein